MRGSVPPLLLAVCLSAGPVLAQGIVQGITQESAASPDRDDLRRQWHRCVRQSFSGQPMSLDRPAAQRAALAACKASEDSYVAAEFAARQDEGAARRKPGLTSRARAFMASVAASVVDPVASWFDGLVR